MSDYSTYLFTLGENPTRHYKGLRLRPRESYKLGLRVASALLKAVSVESFLNKGDASEEQNDETSNKKDTEKYSSQISGIVKTLSAIDVDFFTEITDYICSKTAIECSSDSGDRVNIVPSAPDSVDKWFEMYPQDYLKFSFQIIWENIRLFFQQILQEITGQEIDLAKIMSK